MCHVSCVVCCVLCVCACACVFDHMINDGIKTNGHAHTCTCAYTQIQTKLRCLQCDLQHFIDVDIFNHDSFKDSKCLIDSCYSFFSCFREKRAGRDTYRRIMCETLFMMYGSDYFGWIWLNHDDIWTMRTLCVQFVVVCKTSSRLYNKNTTNSFCIFN